MATPHTNAAYHQRADALSRQIKASHSSSIGLNKATSNLFRSKLEQPQERLDVSSFNHILAVNAEEKLIEVEGMTQYQHLTAAALDRHVMPAVVPQLRSITIGGAAVGGGIEASSFKYGFVHETIQEIDVLLADGTITTARPDNEHRDLFYAIPNSYGTLGYILRLKVLAVPTKPFVKLQHHRYTNPSDYFQAFQRFANQNSDFLDGVIFSKDEMYITVATFTDQAPYTSDYTYQNIFYRSIQQREEDYLTTEDFIWRWDTDWFWCSKNLGAQNPLLRRLYGKDRLNSITYTKIMNFNKRLGLMNKLNQLRGINSESVIQDVEIPIEHSAEFLDFFHQEIGILPVWACPAKSYHNQALYPLYQTEPNKLYINFGFWDVITERAKHPNGYYNKKVEDKVVELQGKKSLYSDVYFDQKTFWQQYNQPAYDAVKAKYDPKHKFPNLYNRVT